MDDTPPLEPDVFTIDPTHSPTGEVPEDAPTAGGPLWLAGLHEEQPVVFPVYFQVVLGQGCKATDDERAARDWSPLCHQMTGHRLLASHWRAFRKSLGWKDHERGPTRRRYGVPIEIVDMLPDRGKGAPRKAPEMVHLCPSCGAMTIQFNRAHLVNIVYYLAQQGELPLEEANNGE
jgi:hypothetical protein